MFVRWGNTYSTSFCVTNGVKQGGIISPMLYNLYMDDLTLMLNCSGIGRYIETSFINHLCYADNLCLISCFSVACNICLIFVKNMDPNISYYIKDIEVIYIMFQEKHT